MKFYLYRPESLVCPDGELRRVDWQTDADLSALIHLSVRLLGGSKTPDRVLSLPVLESAGGLTVARRALVLREGRAATGVLSPVRLPGLARFLCFSLVLRPSKAAPEPGTFAERVARQAREVAGSLRCKSTAPLE